jgi:hypothetical protein
MAGTIEITGGAEWSAATWLYEWALKIASEQIGNPVLKQTLQDVIDSNVGWVNLGDFSPSERAEIAERSTPPLCLSPTGDCPRQSRPGARYSTCSASWPAWHTPPHYVSSPAMQ